jgi:DNA-binding IclR family transcriptional regulator
MEQMPPGGTVEKALDVLYCLHESHAPLGVTQIGRSLSLPKSTTHRLLAALGRRGLVDRDPRGRYRPGMALVTLASGLLERDPVVVAARPVLEEQAAAHGETIFLAAMRAGRILVLDKEEGSGFLRAAPRVGTEIPAYATAIGKLYMALAPDAVSLPEGPIHAFTPLTCLPGPALDREIARVRTQGWASNLDEWILGLTGLAAPVLQAGRMVAAVAVAGASSRFPPLEHGRFIQEILAAGRAIAERLEGRVA